MRDSHPLRLDMAETLKFLLIEDDEDDYVLARDLLNRAFAGRHTLDWIDDWELALETIVRNEHDACLVDYRLGKKDGHQARQPERRTLCRTRSARRRARP